MNKSKSIIIFLLVLTAMMSVCGCGSKNVELVVTEKQMEVIESMPEKFVYITSEENPITTLEGIEDGEFALWVGGGELEEVAKLMAEFGREETIIGLKMMGTLHENASFENNTDLKLFITHKEFEKDLLKNGGVKIKFVIED